MLNLSVGSATEFHGKPFIRTEAGKIGHAIYGPYRPVQPGAYVVTFEMALSNPAATGTGGICALIDVVGDLGQTEINFDFVSTSQLSTEPAAITLRFDLVEARELEFRVYVRGRASLLIADEPVLEPLEGSSGAEPITASKRALRYLFNQDALLSVDNDQVTICANRADLPRLLSFSDADRDVLARQVVQMVGYRGDEENSLYRAFVGTERPIVSPPQPIPFTSSLCHQAHFGLDQYRFWARQLKETPKFQRKQWEFIYIAQTLYERGFLAPGRRGLVFGAGQEQLPSLFASFGVEILATDQAAEDAERTGWSASLQHTFDLAALNQRGICTERMFRELVSFMPVDMNAIPQALGGRFDFCWSACALEHLGSLEHGLRFIENSMRTLRPGGVAVHTTEYNLSSNTDTLETEQCSYYRQCDIESLVQRMTAAGFEVSPIDWSLGEGFAERVVDLPPYAGRGEPHIRLKAGMYDTTSIGLIISKPSE